jgi:hypothetical protein
MAAIPRATQTVKSCLLVVAATIIFAGLGANSAKRGDAAETIAWQSGVEFRRQLELPVAIAWSSNPLRSALGNLSRSHRMAIFVDRRVDPDQLVNFSAPDIPLDDALRKLARQLNVGVCYVGPVIYIGPEPVAAKLATLAAVKKEEARKLPAAALARMARSQTWQWDELATPRELLDHLATSGGVTIVGIEHVPHDLWPAGDLPALSWVDRLSLVLAGFDMTFRFSTDGTQLRLDPMPETVVLERSHAVRPEARQLIGKLAELFPNATIRPAGTQIQVSGSLEDHETIDRLLQGQPIKRPSTGTVTTRYTLTVEDQPLGGIVKALAERLELEAKFDPRVSNEKLNQLVSFRVKDATMDELLKAVLDPAGLSFKLNGKSLEVVPK